LSDLEVPLQVWRRRSGVITFAVSSEVLFIRRVNDDPGVQGLGLLVGLFIGANTVAMVQHMQAQFLEQSADCLKLGWRHVGLEPCESENHVTSSS
jgi:hypothetical protein